MGFGSRHNAKYGMPEMAGMLVTMAKQRGYANSAYQHGPPGVDMPSGDWLLKKIRNVDLDCMSAACGQMISGSARTNTLRLERRNGSCRTCVAAIDKHKIPHHDKNPDMRHLVYSKHEYGTSVFESYITAKVVAGKKEVNICAGPVTRDRFNPEFVRETVKKCTRMRLGIGLYLLDREFYAADVMRVIRQERRHFVMPAKKDAGVKRAIAGHARGLRGAVSRYTMGGPDGFSFSLVIVPAPGKSDAGCVFDRYHTFATSLPCKVPEDAMRHIPEQYRKRWGIETGYRSSKGIRARTNSINPAVRMLLFMVSLVLANIWVCTRREVGRQAYDITLTGFLNMMINSHAESLYMEWPPPG